MRLRSLFLWDMRFQAKYGFYFLYAVLTVIYLIVLLAVPENWREKTAAILIFSDPASMGLFFMGAIVLLEKSQHTPCALAASPVRAAEYIIAKVGSLASVSLIVAAILAAAVNVKRTPAEAVSELTGGTSVKQLCIVLLGTGISSVIFTLLGIIAATKIVSLNQFILWTVPIEAVCFIPAVLHLFRITPVWLRYYPVNVCMEMISGSAPLVIGIIIVMVLIAILFVFSKVCVLKMWLSMGGVKI